MTVHLGGFAAALAYVLREEGGFSNHPDDRGGPTNRGVTQAVYDRHRRSLNVPTQSVAHITGAEVEVIYRSDYWHESSADVMDELGAARLALLHFDAAVQHGPSVAVVFLQRVLGCTPDGIVGPITLRTLKNALVLPRGEDEVIDGYLLRRVIYYRRIIEMNPSQAVFQRGWARRLAHIRAAVVPV